MFVHGGVLPAHAAYGVDRINRETRAWLNGELPRQPGYLSGRNAVVWARDYSTGGRKPLRHGFLSNTQASSRIHTGKPMAWYCDAAAAGKHPIACSDPSLHVGGEQCLTHALAA